MSQSCMIPALQGTQEGEEYLLNLVALRLQSLLVVSTEELRMWKTKNKTKQDAGPRIAEMDTKGMISVSPDSCFFPYIEKH